jgi:hypothetical protein
MRRGRIFDQLRPLSGTLGGELWWEESGGGQPKLLAPDAYLGGDLEARRPWHLRLVPPGVAPVEPGPPRLKPAVLRQGAYQAETYVAVAVLR